MSFQEEIKEYFQMLKDNRYKEAEGLLASFKSILSKTKREQGYFRALEGMLLALKSPNEKNLYLRDMLSSEEELKKAHREFIEHSKRKLHGEYDRGYFTALTDLSSLLLENDNLS